MRPTNIHTHTHRLNDHFPRKPGCPFVILTMRFGTSFSGEMPFLAPTNRNTHIFSTYIFAFLFYRRHHSTETAMLRVLSDVLTAADAQKVTLLSLLDLSAGFDCVDLSCRIVHPLTSLNSATHTFS